MDVTPSFKQTEVGTIPERWNVATIADVSEKITVGFVGSMAHLFRRSGIPLLRGQDVLPGRLDLADTRFISIDTHKQWSKSALRPGDVVMVRVGYPGAACVIPDELGEANAASLVVVRPRAKSLSASYLVFVVNSTFGKRQIESYLVGGAQQVLNTSTAAVFKLPLPPLAEQEAIAEALADVDALIESLEQLLAKKRKIKQGAMQELLTGKTRLPGFSEEWKETTFSEVVRHHSGNSTLIKGKLASEEASDLYAGFSASGQDVWCDHYEHEGTAIVVSAVGSRCGKAFLASGRWCAIANTHVVWPIESKVDLRFLQLFINDEEFWLKSGSGQPFVLFKPSFAQPLLLPSLPEQAAIVDCILDIHNNLSALENQLEKALQVKKGMMQELLTGRIRLV